MRRCQSVDEEDEDKEEIHNFEIRKKCQRNLFGQTQKDNEEEDCWFLDGNFVSLQLNEESVANNNNSDDCDDLKSWLSRDNVTGSSIFDVSSQFNSKTSRESSRRGLKFVPSSVLNSRILRRHTTYIKSMDNVMSSLMTSHSEKCDEHEKPPHVHSWHKRGSKREDQNNNRKRQQVGRQQGTATLSINGLFATFSIMTLSITILCHYAECRVLFIVMLSVVKLSVMASGNSCQDKYSNLGVNYKIFFELNLSVSTQISHHFVSLMNKMFRSA
jgi:hypothetical protein